MLSAVRPARPTLRLLMRSEPGYANVGVYGAGAGVAGAAVVAGPAPPRWRPLYVQRQDAEQQENAYESVGPGAHWWWRVGGAARGCRRHARASQTLEFNSRALAGGAGAAGAARGATMPRAGRAGLLRAVCGVRVELGDARLSASCAAIDVSLPPCVLVLPRWRAPPPLAPRPSCSYHVLPESQRAAPRRTCCDYSSDEDELDGAQDRVPDSTESDE